MEAAIRLVAIVLISYALVLWISSIIWVYRDVRSRSRDQASQLMAVLLVAVFNLPGLIVYFAIRPQTTLMEAYERSLESEALRQELQTSSETCQNCRRPVAEDFNVCPFCKAQLREACRSCGRSIRTNWAVCAYCATERAPRPPTAAAAETPPLQPPRRTTRSTAPQRGEG